MRQRRSRWTSQLGLRALGLRALGLRPLGLGALGLGALVVGALWLAVPGGVAAQAPDAVLLPLEAEGEELAAMRGAVERVLRARIAAHGVVRLGATPALGLEDLQLAVGCMARSPECFSALAAQLETRGLLMPSLERAGDELVVGLSRFDAETRNTSFAVRRVPAGESSAALDVLDGMVREVFGLAAEEAVVPVVDTAPEVVPVAPGEQGSDPGPAIGAGLLLGAGGLTLALGVGLGVASRSSLDAYAQASVASPAEVDAALAHLDRAGAESTAANVLVPVGAALAVGGAVWLLVELLAGDEERAVTVVPVLDRETVGAAVAGSFGGML